MARISSPYFPLESGEDRQPLVLELGPWLTKCSLAGEFPPRAICRTPAALIREGCYAESSLAAVGSPPSPAERMASHQQLLSLFLGSFFQNHLGAIPLRGRTVVLLLPGESESEVEPAGSSSACPSLRSAVEDVLKRVFEVTDVITISPALAAAASSCSWAGLLINADVGGWQEGLASPAAGFLLQGFTQGRALEEVKVMGGGASFLASYSAHVVLSKLLGAVSEQGEQEKHEEDAGRASQLPLHLQLPSFLTHPAEHPLRPAAASPSTLSSFCWPAESPLATAARKLLSAAATASHGNGAASFASGAVLPVRGSAQEDASAAAAVRAEGWKLLQREGPGGGGGGDGGEEGKSPAVEQGRKREGLLSRHLLSLLPLFWREQAGDTSLAVLLHLAGRSTLQELLAQMETDWKASSGETGTKEGVRGCEEDDSPCPFAPILFNRLLQSQGSVGSLLRWAAGAVAGGSSGEEAHASAGGAAASVTSLPLEGSLLQQPLESLLQGGDVMAELPSSFFSSSASIPFSAADNVSAAESPAEPSPALPSLSSFTAPQLLLLQGLQQLSLQVAQQSAPEAGNGLVTAVRSYLLTHCPLQERRAIAGNIVLAGQLFLDWPQLSVQLLQGLQEEKQGLQKLGLRVGNAASPALSLWAGAAAVACAAGWGSRAVSGTEAGAGTAAAEGGRAGEGGQWQEEGGRDSSSIKGWQAVEAPTGPSRFVVFSPSKVAGGAGRTGVQQEEKGEEQQAAKSRE